MPAQHLDCSNIISRSGEHLPLGPIRVILVCPNNHEDGEWLAWNERDAQVDGSVVRIGPRGHGGHGGHRRQAVMRLFPS